MGKKLEWAIEKLDSLISNDVCLNDLKNFSQELKKLNEKDKEKDKKLKKEDEDNIGRLYFAMIHLESLKKFPKHKIGKRWEKS